MIKRFCLVLTLSLVILSACQSPDGDNETMLGGEPFELYLVADAQMTGADLEKYALDDLPLAESPLITSEDLVSYHWERHAFDLTEAAYERMLVIFAGGLPIDGVPFVVVSYGERIYAGAFWTWLSSLSFDGVVILQPFDPAAGTFFINLGYPNADYFSMEDPRSDPRLEKAFKDAGFIE